jgi:hypothetical protein
MRLRRRNSCAISSTIERVRALQLAGAPIVRVPHFAETARNLEIRIAQPLLYGSARDRADDT